MGTPCVEMFPREFDFQALSWLDKCDGHSCLTCRAKPKKFLKRILKKRKLLNSTVQFWNRHNENAEVWLNSTEEKQQELLLQGTAISGIHGPLAARTGGKGTLGWTRTMPVHPEREEGEMLLHKAPQAPRYLPF